jgi:hypothetical protein
VCRGGREAGAALTLGTLRKLDFGVAAAATLLIFYLAFRLCIHAGPLWRDEINTVNLATQPTYVDVLKLLEWDSAPVLHPSLVRLWSLGSWADLDFALRFLGLLMSLVMILTLWLNARVLGIQPPLLTLALFGLHAVTLQAIGSVRPYGLGTLFMLLAFGATWKLVAAPRAATFAYAVTTTVLAVQTLYQNAILVLAVLTAALVVQYRRRDRKGMAMVLATGLAAAASLLPYAGIVARSMAWRPLTQVDHDVPLLLGRLVEVFADASWSMMAVWAVLVAAAAATTVAILRVPSLTQDAPQARTQVLFVVLAATLAVAMYLVFMKVADRFPHDWHFLSLIALVAIALEVIFAQVRRLQWARTGLAVVALLVILPLSAAGVAVRHTNVDLVAKYVAHAARPGDLIVINPWFAGITFNRYYRGEAAWMTLPPIKDLRIHRYDLLKEWMASPAPLAPVYDAMGRTLQAGHRVWLVGGVVVTPPGHVPPSLPPAPALVTGWQSLPYQVSWFVEASYFVQMHAVRWWAVTIPVDQPVDSAENLPLVVAEGWRPT